MMPGSAPEPTSLRSARRWGSPLLRPNSAAVRRGHMHQHPAQAPRGPNSRSRSSQRATVAGSKRMARVPGAARTREPAARPWEDPTEPGRGVARPDSTGIPPAETGPPTTGGATPVRGSWGEFEVPGFPSERSRIGRSLIVWLVILVAFGVGGVIL